MKYAACGAGGTGKTTTMQLIANAVGTTLLASKAHKVFENAGITERDQTNMSPIARWDLQRKILNARLDAENDNPKGFISDRTMLDHFAYCLYRCSDAMGDHEVRVLKEALSSNLSSYDMLFFFPVSSYWTPNPEGLRQGGLAYALDMDSIMFGLLDSTSIPYTIVGSGTPQERASRIIKVINTKGNTNYEITD